MSDLRPHRQDSDTTAIEWMIAVARRYDMRASVWNPIEGCSPVGEGCRNCWAAEEVHRRAANPKMTRYHGLTTRAADGRAVFTGAVKVIEHEHLRPWTVRHPTAFFAPSRSDLFHENHTDKTRDEILAVMALCPRHKFLDLSKRPEIMQRYFTEGPNEVVNRLHAIAHAAYRIVGNRTDKWDEPGAERARKLVTDRLCGTGIKNLWLGVSVWDQQSADEYVPRLIYTPGPAKRFVSYEPALGPVDFRRIALPFGATFDALMPGYKGRKIDLVIMGGESAAKDRRRDMDMDMARAQAKNCADTGTDFFLKQAYVDGKKVSLPELDGRVHAAVPGPIEEGPRP